MASFPALAVGAGIMVRILVSVAGVAQGEIPLAVKVRVTLPFAMSVALGV